LTLIPARRSGNPWPPALSRPEPWLVSLLLLLKVIAGATEARAQAVHYVLTSESRISIGCAGCTNPVVPPETLSGSFELTVMPIDGDFSIQAVAAVRWQSRSFQLTGSGFLQRLGSDFVAIVIDSQINGVSNLLTSRRRQAASSGQIRLSLVTPPDSRVKYRVDLVAIPVRTDGPDADEDGVPDPLDNCSAVPNSVQEDEDGDTVGDACDMCTETALGSQVLDSGCAVEQQCRCEGPAPDAEWEAPQDYVRCVVGALKTMRQRNRISRREVRRAVQDAIRSGCGRKLLAML
jgi:hypothetical protein